jgi:hypothetical protein
MGKVKDGLRAAVAAAVLAGAALSVPSLAAAAPRSAPHRTRWDLGQYAWIRLAPREKGASDNHHPAQVDLDTLVRKLGAVRATTPEGEEALFFPAELAGLKTALAEALALAEPGEDLLLVSGHKRGSGFLGSPLAVTARMFVKDRGLNLIVENTRLELMGRYDPATDWPKIEYGSRTRASKAALACPGALARRPDWLVFALDVPEAPAVAAPAPAAAPVPAAAAPAVLPAGPVAPASAEERLKALKRLREENLITEPEYQAKRAEILKTL